MAASDKRVRSSDEKVGGSNDGMGGLRLVFRLLINCSERGLACDWVILLHAM